ALSAFCKRNFRLVGGLVGIPLLLGGLVSRSFTNLGETIRHAISSAKDYIENFLNNTNWAAIGQTIGKLIGKAIVAIIDFIRHTDWIAVGKEILKLLAEGIVAGATVIGEAVHGIADEIKNYLVGHSPPTLGPLHYLDRVNIVETIAERIRPAPVVRAM